MRAEAALVLCAAVITPACAAVNTGAVTHSAVETTASGATLRGQVMAGGDSVTVSFEYATTANDVRTIEATPSSLGAGTTHRPVTATVSGLPCDTTHYFRVKIAGSRGAAYGAPLSFRTAECTSRPPSPPSSGPLLCSSANVLCVAASAGPEQEFANIQAAVNAAVAGDTVLVHAGNYAGFVVTRSGSAAAPITVKAHGPAVVVDRPSSTGDGIRVNNASYVVIEGFTITGMPAFGLAARGATAARPMRGVVFRDNTVRNSASSNIYASQAADSLIEGNTATGSRASHGIYLANGGSDNTIVRRNVASGNGNNGIHLNGDVRVGGDGLHTGITLADNVLHGNVANGMDLDGIQASTIRNNVIYGNGRHAIRAFRIDAAAGPRDLTIVNNTLLVAAGGGGTGIKLTADGGGHTIFNNIVANEGNGGSIIVANPGFSSDHNIFVNPGFALDGGDSLMPLAQWRAQGGADIASQEAAPEAIFLAPAARDYRLRAGSPAADAGVASFKGRAAPPEDLLGVARPRGAAVDQGAFESF